MTSTIIGVSLAIVGSSLIGISYTASKTAHNRVLEDEEHQLLTNEFSMKQITKQPVWYLGLLLLIAGEIFNFAAYGYAPTSLISPLGALSIVSGAISGSIYLQERIKLRNILGMLVTCAGACVIVAFSKAEEPQLSPEDIVEAVSQISFIVYLIASLCFVSGMLVLDQYLGNKYMMIRVSLTATFSGFTVLATKGLSSLLSLSLYHIFGFWITYVLLIVLVTNALLTLFYTNKALSCFDSTKVLPAEFASFTLSAVLGSAILYKDFDKASVVDIALFLIGCSVTFFGVYLITSGQEKYGKNVQLLTGRESMVIMAGSFLPPLAVQVPELNRSRVSARPVTYAYGTTEETSQTPREEVKSMHGVAGVLSALSSGNLGNAAFQQIVNPPVLVAGDHTTAYQPIVSQDDTFIDVDSPVLTVREEFPQRPRVLTRAQQEFQSRRQKIKSFFLKLAPKQ